LPKAAKSLREMDIDKILLNVINNEASKEEHAALEAWKQESQDNLTLLQDIMRKQELAVSSNYKVYDKEKAWKKVSAQMEPMTVLKSEKSGLAKYSLLLAACFAGLALYFFMNKETAAPSIYQAETEMMAFALEDASQIWLRDGGSSLEIKSDFVDERRVALTGEAFFDIAKDPSKAFIIELKNNDFIKVLGTSFNVINTADDFEISVYSGVVELHTLNRILTLSKGDKVSKELGGAMVKVKDNNRHRLSWKNKELVFDNSELSEVFKAVSDHYNVDIQLDNKTINLANCKVRTKFTNEPIEKVMQQLAKHFGFNYQLVGKTISISDLKCD